MALRDYIAGEIAQDFADGLLTRREALRRLGLLGLGLTPAAALLAACSDDKPKAASKTTTTRAASSKATTTSSSPSGPGTGQGGAEAIAYTGSSGQVTAAYAGPISPRASVLVIHENKGLTSHFFDLVGRLSREGYAAMCPDLLSPEGGTGSLKDPAAAPAALSAAPLSRLLGDLQAGIGELTRRHNTKVGAIGFCFGGGLTWDLLNAGEARLAVAVPFYGPAPEQPDFSRAKAAVLAMYGALDSRVNATRGRAEAALKAAGLTYEIKTFDGADHAFFNDTGPRYNAKAAADAWKAMLDFFHAHLG